MYVLSLCHKCPHIIVVKSINVSVPSISFPLKCLRRDYSNGYLKFGARLWKIRKRLSKSYRTTSWILSSWIVCRFCLQQFSQSDQTSQKHSNLKVRHLQSIIEAQNFRQGYRSICYSLDFLYILLAKHGLDRVNNWNRYWVEICWEGVSEIRNGYVRNPFGHSWKISRPNHLNKPVGKNVCSHEQQKTLGGWRLHPWSSHPHYQYRLHGLQVVPQVLIRSLPAAFSGSTTSRRTGRSFLSPWPALTSTGGTSASTSTRRPWRLTSATSTCSAALASLSTLSPLFRPCSAWSASTRRSLSWSASGPMGWLSTWAGGLSGWAELIY